MALSFPSDEWIKELSNQLNASPSYEQSAQDWEGDFIFVVEPDENYPETTHLFLALFHGKSPGAEMLSSPDQQEAEFVIQAPFGTWRRVIEGQLEPIQGMMTRKLKLRGNMMKIMRYPAAAKEIVSCCARIPTDFGD
ncbi:MAG: SCP2 sterol-binding domain-containing protein [Anaerolineae bacterium]|nr:SCP2 sterol-binding domain-containing protein [Anaerolineae bacterium]